jgi:hypothetical protein
MDIEMSATGTHQMIMLMKEDLWDLNDLIANINNQVERIQVEDVSWCQSQIQALEKPNNPANKSLWQLVNRLAHRVEDQADQISALQAGMIGLKERIRVLEMLLSMIWSWVSTLEEAMEIDPPLTDLTSNEDLTDLEYQDMDDGGAMLVEDLEDERENMPPPSFIRTTTPHPAPVLRELILIEEPAPVTPAVEVINVKGEDDVWYIPPVMCRQIHALDKYSSAIVDPVPDYVEDSKEDPLAGPHHEDLAADGTEDELWANLGVNLRLTE